MSEQSALPVLVRNRQGRDIIPTRVPPPRRYPDPNVVIIQNQPKLRVHGTLSATGEPLGVRDEESRNEEAKRLQDSVLSRRYSLPDEALPENDTSVIDPYASLDINDLIAKTQYNYNEKMIDYERWLIANPQVIPNQDLTFRVRRHELKMLKLRLDQLRKTKEDYLLFQERLAYTPHTPLSSTAFIRSHGIIADTLPTHEMARVGRRIIHKVSSRTR